MVNEVSIHFLVPVILARLLGFDKRLILLLSPFAVLPDIDILTFYHRALTHNIFFYGVLFLISWLALKKWFKVKDIFLVSLLMFMSHILLDEGKIVFLYPLMQHWYTFDFHKMMIVPVHYIKAYSFNMYSLSFKIQQIAIIIIAGIVLGYEAFKKEIDSFPKHLKKFLQKV